MARARTTFTMRARALTAGSRRRGTGAQSLPRSRMPPLSMPPPCFLSPVSPRAHRLASHLLLCLVWQVLPTLQDVRVCRLRWRLQQVTRGPGLFVGRSFPHPHRRGARRTARRSVGRDRIIASDSRRSLRLYRLPRAWACRYSRKRGLGVLLPAVRYVPNESAGLGLAQSSISGALTHHTDTRAVACVTARGRRNPPDPP